jgi:acetyl esterase/lipase
MGFQCAEHAEHLGADPSKGFILGGTSAGGNLAAVAAHQVGEDGMSPSVTGVVLLSALLCHPAAIPKEYKEPLASWEDHKDALVLDRRGIEWFLGKSQREKESGADSEQTTTNPTLTRR